MNRIVENEVNPFNVTSGKKKSIGMKKVTNKKKAEVKKTKPKTKTEGPPKVKFDYFEGLTLPTTGMIPLDFGWNKSTKDQGVGETNLTLAESSITISPNSPRKASQTSRTKAQSKTNNLLKPNIEEQLENGLQQSSRSLKKKTRRKSRLKCEDPSCSPCSVLVNCNTCYYCVNKAKLK